MIYKKFPINRIIIEGADLAGKSTAYRQIHNLTDYQWNIVDRSTLSRLAYAEMYGRDKEHDEYLFHCELSDMNNRVIVLHPPIEEVISRYNERGDDIQDENSLRKLHGIFERKIMGIQGFPNVHVIRSENPHDGINGVVSKILQEENRSVEDISQMIVRFVDNTPEKEAFPLSFDFYDDGYFEDVDESSITAIPEELAYFQRIRDSLMRHIRYEMEENGETRWSRRLIHTNDSCLSMFHAMFRGGTLDCNATIRSSNVKDLLENDIKFIHLLGRDVFEYLKLTPVVNRVRYRVRINSAHIL